MARKSILKNIKLPAQASVWYIGVSLISKAIGIAVTPFFTRLQSEEEYGAFTLYISLLGVVSVILSAFTSGSSIYKGLDDFSNEKGSYLKSVLSASIVFSGVVCTLLFAFSTFLGLNREVVALIFLQLIFDSVVAVYLSDARFSYSYKEVALISLFESTFSPLIAMFWLCAIGGGYKVRAYSLLLVSFISAIYALYKLFSGGGKVRFSMLKYSVKSSLALLPHSLSGALSAQADKLIFTAALGNAALARYSVAHSLGAGLSFVVGGVGSALGPWIMRRLRAGETERISEISELIFKGLGAATVFLVTLAPEAMLILAPYEYSEALVAVLPISLSVLPSLVILISTVVLVHEGRSKYASYSSVVALLLGILLNLLLIPPMRYFGAGLSLLFSQIVGAALSLYLCYKSEILTLPLKSLLYYFILTVLFGAMAVSLYHHLALRVLLLCAPAVMLLGSFFSAGRLIRE
ncbi:MAG: hypothetical protein E7676_02445 [Ruminococcaceae bacterium]|nr:hypothetical protein [Oscillospiraceae bacterium]